MTSGQLIGGATRRSDRAAWLIGALAVTGAIVLVVLLGQLSSSRRRAEQAESDAAMVVRWTNEIRRAGERPAVASLDIEPPDRIARRVEAALREAGIAEAKLLSVDPQLPARLGRSEYQLRATEIELQDVTLREVVDFATMLTDSQGMTVRDLTLDSRSRRSIVREERAEGPEGERWDARLILTQMIFSPISDS